MKCLYVILVCILVLVLAYFVGMHVGEMRCNTARVTNTLHEQTKIIKIQEKINAEIIRNTVDDIRGILRKKYTIAK